MNFGTQGHPEGIEHWTTKAMLRKHMDTGLKHRGAIFAAATERNCARCAGGLIPINLLEGVERVGEVEAPFRSGQDGFIPDFMLWGKDERKPVAFVEVVHTSRPSQEKIAFCRRENIDLLLFSAVAPVANHWQTRLLWPEALALRCRQKERRRLDQLMDYLWSLPDGGDIRTSPGSPICRFGVTQRAPHHQDIQGECTPKAAQQYWVGARTVSAKELLQMAMIVSINLQFDVNRRLAVMPDEPEHGEPISFTAREEEISRNLTELVNTVQWHNVGQDGSSWDRQLAITMNDVWFYPKEWFAR